MTERAHLIGVPPGHPLGYQESEPRWTSGFRQRFSTVIERIPTDFGSTWRYTAELDCALLNSPREVQNCHSTDMKSRPDSPKLWDTE